MPTPCKPVTMLRAEGRSHRTKKELAKREAGEAALATGKALKVRREVKGNPAAYKEFKRVSGLLESIGKNDALVEGSVNRYCEITAEVLDLIAKREEFSKGITELQEAYEADMQAHPALDDRIISTMDYFNTLAKMEGNLLALDKRIQDKRKMLLDIEKENIMTIAAQLRSIPKKADDEEEDDPMAKLFGARGA
ncbi:MAG: hypothetical protein K2K57_14170 [Oscillospiraceae bacterium]|nr:hypothetical protein [Oscillospiraceae bacterium]